MASQPTGFTVGAWNGLPNYRCNYCAFAAPGEAGLLRIKRHVAQHLQRGDPSRAAQPAAGVNFASDEAAELAATHGEEVIAELRRRTPTGRTGYTVADVRSAAAALTQHEPEEG